MKATVTRTDSKGRQPRSKMQVRPATSEEIGETRQQAALSALQAAMARFEQNKQREAIIRDLRGRKATLESELDEVQRRLTKAKAERDLARAMGGNNLEDLRAEVASLEREVDELTGALDVLNQKLAKADPGAQYGKYKTVQLVGAGNTGRDL